jgi:acetylornithine deacetylase/succinyl-diaminopimelate desuccinylase-like protein
VNVQLLASAMPGLVAADSPAVRLAQDAFERVIGTRPLLIRTGGTLPIVPALSNRGIPTIVSGFSLPDANIHSPNERLLVEYVPLGIATAQALLEEFAELRPRAEKVTPR